MSKGGKGGKGGYKQINKTLNVCAFDEYLDAQQAHLPELKDVEQVSPRVLRVLGQNAGKFTLQGTNTYIVGTGSRRLIIDSGQGIPDWADLTSDTLDSKSFRLSHVLLTHWHGDHTGGVPDLIRMDPQLSSQIFKHTPSKHQKPIADGQIFKVEGATVRAVHTPGHSHDHMCFILEEENAMFTGDNVLGHGTSAVELLGTWMSSIKVMGSHNCAVGYPAHGEVIKNLPLKIKVELTQKARREEKVLQTLRRIRREELDSRTGKGRVTLATLVTEMHGRDLNPETRELAIQPFTEEILKKLAEDSRVAFELRQGKKRWFVVDL